MKIFSFSPSLLLLWQSVQAAPAPIPNEPFEPPERLIARHLLGSSFGIPQNASFDYVVVGGGNAGITIAARLAENYTVALVEAGSFYEITNGNLSQIPANDIYWNGKDPNNTSPLVDWGFDTTPQAGAYNATIHYARGKTLGGCTARNYMAYHLGTKDSYQMWADAVGDDSYTYENWLPFFKKSIHYTPPDMTKRAANATPNVDLSTLGDAHGPLSLTFSNWAQAASSYVQKGFAELGIMPINGFTSGKLIGSAYVLETINATTQTRDSSETSFLQSQLHNYNLMVYQSTLAKRVLFDSNKTATGVVVDSEGLQYTLAAKREVILSAGAFQSPQLLMVSGVGPKATLEKHGIPVLSELPGVGQNMWDHILMGPSYRFNVITPSALSDPAYLLKSEAAFNDNQSGILTNSGGDFLAWEKIPSSLRTTWSPTVSSALSSTFPPDWPEVEYISMGGELGFQQNYIRDAPPDAYNYGTVSTALVAPLSRGTIDITSADMADPPLINPNWLTHPADQAVLVAGYKRVRQMFDTEVVKPLLIGEEHFPGRNVSSDVQILDIIRKSVSTVYHASSTCAMGKKGEKGAVVDNRGRVFGVGALRVVDASAFPFLPPGHPMATVYALAEKIAADIKGGK
ncbi:hypothetical protein MMC30_006252 [Trapelia coarctata]|nr:hypothetical protein [Trapelia coarctata]